MKINHITPVFLPYRSGISNVVFNQARELANRGHQVVVVTPRYKPDWLDNEDLGFRIKDLRIRKLKPLIKSGNAALVPGLMKVLKHEIVNQAHDDVICSEDTPPFSSSAEREASLKREGEGECVVHLHLPFFGGQELVWLYCFLHKPTPLVPLRWRGLRRLKLVVQYHHDPQFGWFKNILTWPSRLIMRSLIKSADRVIVSSLDYAKNSVVKDLIDNRFVEVPLGVDVERFKISAYANGSGGSAFGGKDLRLKSEKSSVVSILFVGALDRAHQFKGIETLLEAVRLLSNYQLPVTSYQLQIVGGGDLLQYYKALAGKLGIADNATFLGLVPDDELPAYYQASDIFIFPSTGKAEAFGLVALEAMASGLPVIASDLPGVRTLTRNTDMLFPPGDAAALAQRIAALLNNPSLRAKIGEENRQLVLGKYMWEGAVNQLENLYLTT